MIEPFAMNRAGIVRGGRVTRAPYVGRIMRPQFGIWNWTIPDKILHCAGMAASAEVLLLAVPSLRTCNQY